ncbi:MAG: class I SAM-dependent methyltransferase, partial [Pseudomonadota bacterium]
VSNFSLALMQNGFSIRFEIMSRIFDYRDATRFENWLDEALYGHAVELRQNLILKLLDPLPGARILDIGCGTGRDLAFFARHGLDVSGVDPSPFMLDAARVRLGGRAELFRCFGEDLPLEDNSCDMAVLIHTLEFVDNPAAVFAEACRVAKDRVFIGCVNRFALRALGSMKPGGLAEREIPGARFFSVGELKRMVRHVLGDVPVKWRTAFHLPLSTGPRRRILEGSSLVQRSPWGAFVAMVVTPVPRFRLRPLDLRYAAREPGRLATGVNLAGGTGMRVSENRIQR